MVAADVVVPLEVPVVFAHVPILVCHYPVFHPAVVQHRKVKAPAIPADELGPMFLDGIEKGLDDLAFRGVVPVHERMDTQTFGVAKHRADNQNALQVQRYEVGLPLFLALSQPGCIDFRIA